MPPSSTNRWRSALLSALLLIRNVGNAAAAEGDVVSPHLTGATIDIAKGGLGRQEIGWMRAWLLPLQLAGKIDVEEEFRQACFHITVYKSYEPAMPVTSIAGAKTVPQSSTQAPAPASPAKKAATPQDKPIKTSRLAPEVAGAVFAHGR
jgi:hypothetical protein